MKIKQNNKEKEKEIMNEQNTLKTKCVPRYAGKKCVNLKWT